MANELAPWWGTFELAEGVAGRWQIGASTLDIARGAGEWQLAHRSGDDPLAAAGEVALPFPELDAQDLGEGALRFVTTADVATVRVSPALADRPVVARPLRTLVVQPGDQGTLLVSSSVWLQVDWPGRPDLLLDAPVARPSDTWFGPSRTEGELCYATRTRARVTAADLPVQPGRALTALTVENRSAAPLHVARAKLPVQRLALFIAEDGRLWTDALRVVAAGPGEEAEVRIDAAAAPGTRLAEPRLAGRSWKRALSGLLG